MGPAQTHGVRAWAGKEPGLAWLAAAVHVSILHKVKTRQRRRVLKVTFFRVLHATVAAHDDVHEHGVVVWRPGRSAAVSGQPDIQLLDIWWSGFRQCFLLSHCCALFPSIFWQ